MKRIVLVLPLLLTACGRDNVTARILQTWQYHELPPIEAPPQPNLQPVVWDIPRDITRRVVRNTTDCLRVPESQRNDAFWRRCGSFAPQPNSNLFIGLDQQNFEALQLNLEQLEARDRMWRNRIDEVNRQRAEWRQRANQQSTPPHEASQQ